MTDQNTQTPTEARPEDELALLRERAKLMGINTGNAGIDALKKKIAEKLAEKPAEETQPDTDDDDPDDEDRPMTRAERDLKIRERLKREKMKLVRCRIHNLNPAKRELQGEIITVANRYLGTVRKLVPFGEATDNGYHIPQVLLDELQSRKFQSIRTKKVNGNITVERRIVPEYSVEVLPPLTAEELQDLAMRQAAAERLGA